MFNLLLNSSSVILLSIKSFSYSKASLRTKALSSKVLFKAVDSINSRALAILVASLI